MQLQKVTRKLYKLIETSKLRLIQNKEYLLNSDNNTRMLSADMLASKIRSLWTTAFGLNILEKSQQESSLSTKHLSKVASHANIILFKIIYWPVVTSYSSKATS